MYSNLPRLFQIQKVLKSIGYPDAHRVSLEIDDYLTNNPDIDPKDILERIKNEEPWEYIRGNTEFLGNTFLVTPDTLIPRIETEQLVKDACEYIKDNDISNIIDVGTGSGCIAISLAKIFADTDIKIFATDISIDALNIAKQNEKNILTQQNIKWYNTNLIQNIYDIKGNTVLVANLPYIPTAQYLELDKSVKNFEPRIALDGGIDGLKYIRELLQQIIQKDIKPKALFLETEESIFNPTFELIGKLLPNFTVAKKSDLFERDRFVYAYKD